MIRFILNNRTIETDLPIGTTVLDFVRYHKNLKGTKIGCREGDCGACTVLVGELKGDSLQYRTMTSCLMPLANAAGKHLVTVEGINPPESELTPVQQAILDESGTQCGFCTVGFVISLTGFCLDETAKSAEMAVSAVDGNICRCTGYKSIERASAAISRQLAGESDQWSVLSGQKSVLDFAIKKGIVPEYFSSINERLKTLQSDQSQIPNLKSKIVAGGTDLYVQKHEEMVYAEASHILFDDSLRTISEAGEWVELGASVVARPVQPPDDVARLRVSR